MSTHYIGYGFDSYDLELEDLYDFVIKFDKENYDAYIKDYPNLSEEEQIENIDNFIVMNYCFYADYIVDIIQQDLWEKCIIYKEDTILKSWDNFIVFPPTQFADDEKAKLKLIKNKNDLIKLIKNYFPNAKIKYGEVKEAGTDWIEPEYIID